MPRSYQVTPGILGRRRATQPKKVRPTADSMDRGQPAADREPSRPRRTPPPDAPRLSLTWIGAVEVVATALAAVRRTRKRRGFELRSVGNSRPLGPCLCAALTRPSRAALPLVVRRDSQTSVHAGSRTRRESMRGAPQSALTRGGDRTGSVHGGGKSRARRDPPARRRGSEAKGPGEPKVGEHA
jgi:hypothetical protein